MASPLTTNAEETDSDKISISDCTISFIWSSGYGTDTYVYDGSLKKPSVAVTYGSTTLTKGTDYSVSYYNLGKMLMCRQITAMWM